MKKIPTLLPKDPNDLGKIIAGPVTISVTHFAIKIDGTSCLIKDGKPYCRYDAKLFKKKRGKITATYTPEELSKNLPEGAIPCQEPDTVSGHWPHWVPVLETKPEHQYILEGFNSLEIKIDGTYECIGPKVQNNPHGEESHKWVHHVSEKLIFPVQDWETDPFNFFKELFADFGWEGLVAYNEIEPVAKIRRSDYGFTNSGYNSIKTLDI